MMEIDRINYTTGDTGVIAQCIQMCQVSTDEISQATDKLVAISALYVGPTICVFPDATASSS